MGTLGQQGKVNGVEGPFVRGSPVWRHGWSPVGALTMRPGQGGMKWVAWWKQTPHRPISPDVGGDHGAHPSGGP